MWERILLRPGSNEIANEEPHLVRAVSLFFLYFVVVLVVVLVLVAVLVVVRRFWRWLPSSVPGERLASPRASACHECGRRDASLRT